MIIGYNIWLQVRIKIKIVSFLPIFGTIKLRRQLHYFVKYWDSSGYAFA